MKTLDTIHIVMAVIFGIGFLMCIIIPIWLHFEEKSNSKDKKSKSCLNLVAAALLVIAGFVILGMCSKHGGDWEPRHTQNVKYQQKNVNHIFLYPLKLSIL